MREDINLGKAVYNAAHKAGTSLLEMSVRLGVSAFQLEKGWVRLDLVAADTGLSVEEIEQLGAP